MSVSLIDGHIDDDVQELKTCPFCGGEAKTVKSTFSGLFLVYCKHCYATSKLLPSVEVAIEAWNRRVDNGN